MGKIKCLVIKTNEDLQHAHEMLTSRAKSNFSLYSFNGELLRIKELTTARHKVEHDTEYEHIGSYTVSITLEHLMEDVIFCGINLK